MKLRCILLAATFICLLASGCSTSSALKEEPIGNFWGRYTNGLPAKSKPVDRQLVHLGIPTTDQIVVWYALAQDESDQKLKSFNLTVLKKADQALVSAKIRQYHSVSFGTGRIEIGGLEPDTEYTITMQTPGELDTVVTARTRPENVSAFSFLASSCFQPFAWNIEAGTNSHLTVETVEMLRAFRTRALQGKDRKTHRDGPSFALAFGDQVYVDPGAEKESPISLLYGRKSEVLRGGLNDAGSNLGRLYRIHLGLDFMDDALAALPTAMVWDDHDIRDGWGSHGDEATTGWQRYYRAAKGAYEAFQLGRNPNFQELQLDSRWVEMRPDQSTNSWSMGTGPEWEESRGADSYFTFDWGAASFFVIDGRTSRNWVEAQTISEAQFEAIRQWLVYNSSLGEHPRALVLCSPVPVMGSGARTQWLRDQNWVGSLPLIGHFLDDSRDRLASLEEERLKLVSLLESHAGSHSRHRLVILSGDVHYAGLQVLEGGEGEKVWKGYEIISSGLAQTEFAKVSSLANTIAKPVGGVNVWNHGAHSAPNFSEIFVDASHSDAAPEIKVLLYTPTFTDGVWRLEAANVRVEDAFKPEDVKENTQTFIQRILRTGKSELEPFLRKKWDDIGRRPLSCRQAHSKAESWE